MDFLQSTISFHQIHYNTLCTIIFHPNHELSGKHNSCSCVVPSCTYFHWAIRQAPNRLKVLTIHFFLFLYIWSKSMLHGIWDENRREALMKMMCSNHSNTLLRSLKLPSCRSENYEGRKRWNCTKLEWHDRPWRECQEYHQFQCLYEGLCWSCGHVLKWPWPCLQHSGASGLLIDVFGNRHSL